MQTAGKKRRDEGGNALSSGNFLAAIITQRTTKIPRITVYIGQEGECSKIHKTSSTKPYNFLTSHVRFCESRAMIAPSSGL